MLIFSQKKIFFLLIGVAQLFACNVNSEDLTLYKKYDSEFSLAPFPSRASSLCPSIGIVPMCHSWSNTWEANKPKSDPLDSGFFNSFNSLSVTLSDSYQKLIDAYQDSLRKQYVSQVNELKRITTSLNKTHSSVATNAGIIDTEYANKLKSDQYLNDLNNMLVLNNADAFLHVEKNNNEYEIVSSSSDFALFSADHACRIEKYKHMSASIRRDNTPSFKRTNELILQSQIKNNRVRTTRQTSYQDSFNGGVSTKYILINDSLSVASINSINIQIMRDWMEKEDLDTFINNRRDIISKNLLSGSSTDELQIIAINHNNALELINSELSTLEKIELNLVALLSRKVVKNTTFNTIR